MSEKHYADYIASPLARFKLNWFGVVAYEAFDSCPYLVGSALKRRDHRDVDVRVILMDDDFLLRFGLQTDWRSNRALKAMNLAFSALGQEMTGLPVDFQVEQMTDANASNIGGARNALGIDIRVLMAAGFPREREA